MFIWDEVTVLRLLAAVIQEAKRRDAFWAATRGEALIVPLAPDPDKGSQAEMPALEL